MRPHQQAPSAKYKHLLPSTSSPKGVASTPAPSSPPPPLLGATHPLRSLDRPPRLRRDDWSSSVAPINRHRRRNGPFRSLICVAPCVVVIVVIVVATKTPSGAAVFEWGRAASMTRSGCDDEADGVDGIWLDGAWLGVRVENFFFLAKTAVCGLAACQLRGKTPVLTLEMA